MPTVKSNNWVHITRRSKGQSKGKSLNDIIISAASNDNLSNTIVPEYNPTNSSDETDIISFYHELFFLVRHIPKHNVLIIGGAMNAQIGKDENN